MSESFIQCSVPTQAQTARRLLFAGLILLIGTPICFSVDLIIARTVNYKILPGDLRTIFACSEAFSHLYGVMLILLAIWFSAPHLREKLKAIVMMLVTTGIIVSIAKNSVLRIRPRQNAAIELESVWDSFEGISPLLTQFDFSKFGESTLQSYPSGHTAMAFVLAIGLTLTLPKSRGFFFLFAILASGQRIAFSAHFLSDVFAGASFALISSAIFVSTSYARRVFFTEPQTFQVVEPELNTSDENKNIDEAESGWPLEALLEQTRRTDAA